MPTMVAYTAGEHRLHTAYSFALLGARPDGAAIARQMTPWQQGDAAAAWPSWAFSNHDAVRVASRWGGVETGGFAFGGAAAEEQQASSVNALPAPALYIALLACLRGTLFIYQGEELGLPQAEVAFDDLQDPFGKANWPTNKGRDGCRTPMPWLADAPGGGFSTGRPWLPLAEAHRALAVDRQDHDPASTLNQTRRLLALRRAHAALRLGSFDVLRADGAGLVVQRRHGGDVVLAAFNLGSQSLRIDLPQSPLPLGQALAIAGASLDGSLLLLPAWSALIQPLSATLIDTP
jgi:alpha-glucosidase